MWLDSDWVSYALELRTASCGLASVAVKLPLTFSKEMKEMSEKAVQEFVLHH